MEALLVNSRPPPHVIVRTDFVLVDGSRLPFNPAEVGLSLVVVGIAKVCFIPLSHKASVEFVEALCPPVWDTLHGGYHHVGGLLVLSDSEVSIHNIPTVLCALLKGSLCGGGQDHVVSAGLQW